MRTDYHNIKDVIPKRNYFEGESECRCNKCDGLNMERGALYKFNQIREFLGVPIYMSSGKRCELHDIEYEKYLLNGEYTGQHYFGLAGDLSCTGNLRYAVLRCAIELGATGIAFGSSFIHIDFREGTPTTWTY